MKHDCPHCGIALKFRFIRSKALPGQRRFLPERATSICPECGGPIALNTHWSEIVTFGALAVPALFYMQRRPVLEPTPVLWWACAFLVFAAVIFTVFHFRYWQNWQRYKAFRS